MKNLFIENFRGIRSVNSVSDISSSGSISAVKCCNTELHYTDKGTGVAIFSSRGNKQIKDMSQTIIGQFESVQGGISYWFVYAVDDTRGYLYVINTADGSCELLDVKLSATKICNAITIAQGYDDWFVFTNGKDDYVGVCMAHEAVEERVSFLNASDAEGRDIRGLALEVQNGRLVTCCKNRVHWSAQGNIFDWASSDSGIWTIPAYQEFDRDVTAIVFYNNSLIVFTDDYSVVFRGDPGDASNFYRAGATGGGCPSFRALIKFDNKLFYYDNKAKNIFAYYVLDTGQTRPTKGYADDILPFLTQISENRINEIEMISYISGNQSEIWIKIPAEEKNIILIYDYLKHEWVERCAQKDIHAFAIIGGNLYSAYGSKILKENLSSSFDGVYIPSEYKTALINLGSDSNLKVPKMPLIITLDWQYDNDFYIEFIYDDMPEKSKIKHVVKLNHGYLVWSKTEDDANGGKWALDADDEEGGVWVSSDKNTVMFNLDGVLHFKQLQIRIYTEQPNQEFAIRRLEFKRVKLKTKTLG